MKRKFGTKFDLWVLSEADDPAGWSIIAMTVRPHIVAERFKSLQEAVQRLHRSAKTLAGRPTANRAPTSQGLAQ